MTARAMTRREFLAFGGAAAVCGAGLAVGFGRTPAKANPALLALTPSAGNLLVGLMAATVGVVTHVDAIASIPQRFGDFVGTLSGAAAGAVEGFASLLNSAGNLGSLALDSMTQAGYGLVVDFGNWLADKSTPYTSLELAGARLDYKPFDQVGILSQTHLSARWSDAYPELSGVPVCAGFTSSTSQGLEYRRAASGLAYDVPGLPSGVRFLRAYVSHGRWVVTNDGMSSSNYVWSGSKLSGSGGVWGVDETLYDGSNLMFSGPTAAASWNKVDWESYGDLLLNPSCGLLMFQNINSYDCLAAVHDGSVYLPDGSISALPSGDIFRKYADVVFDPTTDSLVGSDAVYTPDGDVSSHGSFGVPVTGSSVLDGSISTPAGGLVGTGTGILDGAGNVTVGVETGAGAPTLEQVGTGVLALSPSIALGTSIAPSSVVNGLIKALKIGDAKKKFPFSLAWDAGAVLGLLSRPGSFPDFIHLPLSFAGMDFGDAGFSTQPLTDYVRPITLGGSRLFGAASALVMARNMIRDDV